MTVSFLILEAQQKHGGQQQQQRRRQRRGFICWEERGCPDGAASPTTLVAAQGDKGKHSPRNQSAGLMWRVHQQGSEFMLSARYLQAQNC